MCAVLQDRGNELSSLMISAVTPALVLDNFVMTFFMSEILFKCPILLS